jgi:hypothetical protein
MKRYIDVTNLPEDRGSDSGEHPTAESLVANIEDSALGLFHFFDSTGPQWTRLRVTLDRNATKDNTNPAATKFAQRK